MVKKLFGWTREEKIHIFSLFTKMAAVILTGLILCFWVGIERIVNDHEVGVVWVPFVKKHPTLQLYFSNPTQKSLEIIDVERLSNSEKEKFVDFCKVRFGEKSISKCYKLLNHRIV
jgi:hypothetical protein